MLQSNKIDKVSEDKYIPRQSIKNAKSAAHLDIHIFIFQQFLVALSHLFVSLNNLYKSVRAT